MTPPHSAKDQLRMNAETRLLTRYARIYCEDKRLKPPGTAAEKRIIAGFNEDMHTGFIRRYAMFNEGDEMISARQHDYDYARAMKQRRNKKRNNAPV